MNDTLDLKDLEKRAFRSMHQDGLWDIYIGGIVLSMAALTYATAGEKFSLLGFCIFLFGVGMSFFIYRAGKKFITTPRLGQVIFGPQRQRRKRTLAMALSGIVFMQVAILAGTIFLWQNPHWAANQGFALTNPDLERLVVATIGAMIVGLSTPLIAYFNDFARGYYIAFILTLGVFSLIWFSEPIYLITAGLLIIVPGVVIFVRFLRKHPLPPAEVPHD